MCVSNTTLKWVREPPVQPLRIREVQLFRLTRLAPSGAPHQRARWLSSGETLRHTAVIDLDEFLQWKDYMIEES